MKSLEEYAAAKLLHLESKNLKRSLVETHRSTNGRAKRSGRDLISFACNDYLNLSGDPRVGKAAQNAIQKYGAGAGASRLVTGNHPLYQDLERRLARLKGTEDACVFGSGYLANLGIIPSLVGAEDLIVVDELSHACLLAASKLSSAQVKIFKHNDTHHAREILEQFRSQHPRAMILTDGVFSMDGDLAPLNELCALAQRFDSWLMTDDAHGVGVLGAGRGSTFSEQIKVSVPLQMGTLSKAIGSYGGYLCASKSVISLMRTRARTLIYSTGLPPAVIAASIAALQIIEDEPERSEKPVKNARLFAQVLGISKVDSCIVPLVIGDPKQTLDASEMLEQEGYLVTAIRPPTVPEGTARLRFAFTAAHSEHDILRLGNLVKQKILKG